jgi:hypothetical protein
MKQILPFLLLTSCAIRSVTIAYAQPAARSASFATWQIASPRGAPTYQGGDWRQSSKDAGGSLMWQAQSVLAGLSARNAKGRASANEELS